MFSLLKLIFRETCFAFGAYDGRVVSMRMFYILLLIKLISDRVRHEFISLSNHCHCSFNKPPWSDFTVT